MSSKIVVVGSLNMDLVVRAQRHPLPGETLLGGGFKTFPGGKGANQAVAAARLSQNGLVCMVGRVGEDAFGNALLENAKQDGVDTYCIRKTPGVSTGVALITLDANGQNTIVVAPGANAQLTPEDIQASEDIFDDASILLVQLEVPLPAVMCALKMARQKGLRTILNPAPAMLLPQSLFADVDILIPNQHELALLSKENSVSAGIEQMLAMGVNNLVVTMGAEGVIVVDKEQLVKIEGLPVTVVDTVAAGDAFVGAFAVGLSEGKSLLESAIWGNAAGALAVTRAGAQPSLPRRDELEIFLTHPNK